MLTWMGRRKTALWGALVLTFAMVGTAGATAGAMLHLGVVNKSNTTTVLTGTATGPELRITNNGTGPALALGVDSNRPAFSVSSTAKIQKLNADKLDGLDSSHLQRRIGGTCDAGSAIRAVRASGSVACEEDDIDGGDAATVGGLAASALQQRVYGACGAGSAISSVNVSGSVECEKDDIDGGNAAKVGGLPATAFLRASIDHNVSPSVPNHPGSQNFGAVSCDSGYVAISGGVRTSSGGAPKDWSPDQYEPSTQTINSSVPDPYGTGWAAAVTNHSDTSATFRVFVLCVPGSNVTMTTAPDTTP
jgi:hypothetical protein